MLLTVSCFVVLLASETNGNADYSASIAFIGNSFIFVNDLPRVMEALSEGEIERQDSCLHGALSVTSLLQRGNGMYNHWGNSTKDEEFPDFGACTVLQLLMGYDEGLVDDFEDYYTDDGLNPCFQDSNYLQYSVTTRYASSSSLGWDFVVINDQSMYPAVYGKRMKSASTLREDYGAMLNATQSIPILYQTWAYWREDINMTGFVNIPTFTYNLKQGYEYYAEILEEVLPDNLKPKIAPVGLG